MSIGAIVRVLRARGKTKWRAEARHSSDCMKVRDQCAARRLTEVAWPIV